MADKKEMTKVDVEKQVEERDPEKLTEQEADKVVEEIVDFRGRRAVEMPGGSIIYIRPPTQGESEMAEQVYSMTLFKCHKTDGLPYVAQVAREVLTMVDDPDTFGKRERTIINQKEIEDTIEANKTMLLAWEEEKKTSPKAKKPEEIEAPEPIPDEGCSSLKDILSDTEIGPFEKTAALMDCLQRTEFANLVIHTAEYRAGKTRNRRIIQSITELGEKISEREMKFTRYWKTPEDFSEADPAVVGYVEMAYSSYQNEVNSQDFLLRLLSALGGGDSKSSSEDGSS